MNSRQYKPSRLTRLLAGLGVMVRSWHYKQCSDVDPHGDGEPVFWRERISGYRFRRLSELRPARKRSLKAKDSGPVLPFTDGESK